MYNKVNHINLVIFLCYILIFGQSTSTINNFRTQFAISFPSCWPILKWQQIRCKLSCNSRIMESIKQERLSLKQIQMSIYYDRHFRRSKFNLSNEYFNISASRMPIHICHLLCYKCFLLMAEIYKKFPLKYREQRNFSIAIISGKNVTNLNDKSNENWSIYTAKVLFFLLGLLLSIICLLKMCLRIYH